MQQEAGSTLLTTDYSAIRKLFINISGSAFLMAPAPAQELALLIRELLLQQNCMESTGRLAQVRLLFDAFLIAPYNQLLVTALRAKKTKLKTEKKCKEETET